AAVWGAGRGRAADTAAHIASDPRTLPPQAVAPAPVERRYGVASIGGLALAERITLVERAERAARAYDPRIDKVIVSLSEETRAGRIADSAGALGGGTQPPFSSPVSAGAGGQGRR